MAIDATQRQGVLCGATVGGQELLSLQTPVPLVFRVLKCRSLVQLSIKMYKYRMKIYSAKFRNAKSKRDLRIIRKII